MVKKLLDGTVEEQCEFLYELGIEKMKTGNYAGALYAFKEVAKHDAEYLEVSVLLATARERKHEQKMLIMVGLAAGFLFMVIGRLSGVSHDLALILLGALGLVCGYLGYSWTQLDGLTNPFGKSLT